MDRVSGLKIGLALCVLPLFWLTTSCSVGDGDRSPSVITVESSDLPPSTKSKDTSASSETDPLESQEIAIAKCLASKGAVLYGASWCSHTKKQIAAFKDGFEYLSYVECTKQAGVCEEKGISGYPTWIIGGSRILGNRTPEALGSAAGCSS